MFDSYLALSSNCKTLVHETKRKAEALIVMSMVVLYYVLWVQHESIDSIEYMVGYVATTIS